MTLLRAASVESASQCLRNAVADGVRARHVSLVDLQLDAQVETAREEASQVGGQAVIRSAVGVVAADAELQGSGFQGGLPTDAEVAFQWPARVVQQADVSVSRLSAEPWSKGVYREVEHRNATVREPADMLFDTTPVRRVVARNDVVSFSPTEPAREVGEDPGIVQRPVEVDEEARRGRRVELRPKRSS